MATCAPSDIEDPRNTMKLPLREKNGRAGCIAFSMLSQPCISQALWFKWRLACFVTSPRVLVIEKCGVIDEEVKNTRSLQSYRPTKPRYCTMRLQRGRRILFNPGIQDSVDSRSIRKRAADFPRAAVDQHGFSLATSFSSALVILA